jgi:hypothetical protein
MSVKKVFIVLITVVACIVIGVMVLNVFLPNVTASMSNAVEDAVYSGVGLEFDFNGDGNGGGNTEEYNGDKSYDYEDSNVDGFK